METNDLKKQAIGPAEIIRGKRLAKLKSFDANRPSDFAELLETAETIIEQEYEASRFAYQLSRGDIDAAPPGRDNPASGIYKELQSQLNSLALAMDVLASGRMVGKTDYPGRLFKSFAKLVNAVALSATKASHDGIERRSPSFNSWRYHQILSAFDTLRAMVIEITDEGGIIYKNRSAKLRFGKADTLASGVDGALWEYLAAFDAEGKAFPVFTEIYDARDAAWYKVTTEKTTYYDGSEGFLHVIDDVSEWKTRESHLIHSAVMDSLTGVYIRRIGIQALENALSASGEIDLPCCAAFIDVDKLKTINDVYGHTEGDRAIRAIAEVISSSIRSADVVCRYGGDEFMIVFKRCGIEKAEKALNRMADKIARINATGDYPYTLSFSRGLVEIIPGEVKDALDVISRIDKLMYEDKRGKK